MKKTYEGTVSVWSTDVPGYENRVGPMPGEANYMVIDADEGDPVYPIQALVTQFMRDQVPGTRVRVTLETVDS